MAEQANIYNEAARKERFIVLLCELFPHHTDKIIKFAGGAESYLSVNFLGKKKYGFVDTLFGNLVIEFEHELPSMLKTAQGQLKGYIAKLWSNRQDYTPYQCIATDGVRWHVYTPTLLLAGLEELPIAEAHVGLIQNERIDLSEDASAENFCAWLDRIFFRENHIRPDGKIIATEYGQAGHVFVRAKAQLELSVQYVQEAPEFKVAFENWAKYLRYTYGELNANTALFLRHSYMSAFSKLLVASILSKPLKKGIDLSNILEVVNGGFFAELNVQNYCEKDFFGWLNEKEVASQLKDLWFSIFNSLAIYDFDKVNNDFLKDIYQELIDPQDRHELGEFYTPDWLCERLVAQLLPTKDLNGKKIADITCGSGSFLRAAIVQVRASLESELTSVELLNSIVGSIHGFEIHPMAAFIAKTNYLIAISDLIRHAERPISIPVYLCDSLLTPGVGDNLFNYKNIRLQLGKEIIELPKALTHSSQLLTDFIDYCESQAEHALEEKAELLKENLQAAVRPFLKKRGFDSSDEIVDAAYELANILLRKKMKREDSIWAYVLKNNLQPLLFENFFDVIVGNPPWLAFRYVSDENYRKQLEYLGIEKYKVAPKTSSLRTQMELATIFFAHACGYYLKRAGKVGLVMPRSIFTADHHALFREDSVATGIKLVELWDLVDVTPLFNVPTCVVIAEKSRLQSIASVEQEGRIGGLNEKEEALAKTARRDRVGRAKRKTG